MSIKKRMKNTNGVVDAHLPLPHTHKVAHTIDKNDDRRRRHTYSLEIRSHAAYIRHNWFSCPLKCIVDAGSMIIIEHSMFTLTHRTR